MKPKSVFIELLILIILIAVVVLPVWFTAHATLDINMHDTYFVVKPFALAYQSCLILITLVYFIKEAYFKYRRRLPNLILVTTNALLIVSFFKSMALAMAMEFVTSMMQNDMVNDGSKHNGWTLYPPLSQLGKSSHSQIPSLEPAGGSLGYIINFFLVTLVIITFLTGKNWNIKQPNAKA